MAFGKRKQPQMEKTLDGILNSQDADVVVVRGKECSTLYMNEQAQNRLPSGVTLDYTCKAGYGKLFKDLCTACPLQNDAGAAPAASEAESLDGRIFSVSTSSVEWLDEKASTVMFLRDVTQERADKSKLYNLAYIDHLTAIPNRRKLREDFDNLIPDLENGSKIAALALFDLDNFKSINDTYGHNTGDVMLKRLTEHFESDAAFSGHVYRLGGDEFVLLFSYPALRFPDEATLLAYHDELLQRSLLSYTMPNIEMACTLSMGIAFSPMHGSSFSDLLRKADIALYKAKALGRNQKVFFEDRYDNAKKFKDLYINIQPILTHLGRTYGYELTDRGDENARGEDSMSLAEYDRALDALGLSDMDNNAKYFIHFTNSLLSLTVLNHLPKDKFIIQVPAKADVSAIQLGKYKELRKHGYSLALTGIEENNVPAALLELVDFCKFAPEGIDAAAQRQFIAANPGKRFIATEVDDNKQFDAAQQRGFKLFQGFFFNQPVVVKKTKDVDPMKVNYLRLLKLTSTDDYVNFQEISSVISSDVALSYKLLRLLNSAALGLKNQISSIEMAVAYLGEEHLKKWIALLALRGIASDKPLELVRMSLIRAQFGELLTVKLNPPRDSKHVFLVGLFSLLHIALEKTKEELFNEIPVAEDIKQSLLSAGGPYSDLVAFFSNYEYANWDEVSFFAQKNGLTDNFINDSYIAAVKWYNTLVEDT